MIVNGKESVMGMQLHVCLALGLVLTLSIPSSIIFAERRPHCQGTYSSDSDGEFPGAGTSPETDAFHNPNVFNAFKMIERAFYSRYPCPVKNFEPLSYRFRRESKDRSIILIRGIATTHENVEDFVHMEIEDNRPRKAYVLFGIANRKRESDRLPEEIMDAIKPCPKKRPRAYYD